METGGVWKGRLCDGNLLLIDGVGFYNLHNNKSFVFRVYPAGKWGGGRGKKKIPSLLYYSRYPSPLSYFTSEPQLERSSHSNIHSFKDRDFNFFVVGSTEGASSYIVDRRSLVFRRVFRVRITRPNSIGKEARRMYWQPSFSRRSSYCKWTFKRKCRSMYITYERYIARSRKLSVKMHRRSERHSIGAPEKKRGRAFVIVNQ